MMTEDIIFDIEKTTQSRIDTLDFENLRFGREFSDHLFYMDYKDGAWDQPKIIPFQNMSLHPAISAIHYGQSIFEGMKAFKNDQNEIFLFRPEMNIARFNISAERMCMPAVPTEIFKEGLKRLIQLDANWIPLQKDSALYIRPFMFATDEYIGVKPSETYRFVIFTCPVNKYYAGEVKVKIEMEYSRAIEGGTGFAKAAGNYAGALYPAKLAQEQGYDQLIWTDAKEHKYIEESGTMNLVFKVDGKIISPAVGGTILKGITRDSILTLAKDWGYQVEERKVEVSELLEWLKKGKLEEAFGAGTAATVAPIKTIGYMGTDYQLNDVSSWEFAPRVLHEMDLIKRGLKVDQHHWNFRIL